MISVIVPVYNVEKYLDKCIQSILGQTYKDFELILVDDGSTDNSGKMCDEYAQNDSRIRVIHKANGGLSEARNYGTLAAHGTHLTYIDSDDYVCKDYLKGLFMLKEQYKTDISVLGIQSVKENEAFTDNRGGVQSICVFFQRCFETCIISRHTWNERMWVAYSS